MGLRYVVISKKTLHNSQQKIFNSKLCESNQIKGTENLIFYS
jgi:hypothetical protein